MSFGSDFLKGFFGSDYLKDYTHASKTFRSNGYELAPKHKFLFYVKFNLNTAGIPSLSQLFPTAHELGLVVKTADLPAYTFDTTVMNQYNRKRIVQSRVDYDPVGITFHDDHSNMITNMWYNYFSYYYRDPSHKYRNVSAGESSATLQSRANYNDRDTYIDYRDQNDWGYVGEGYTGTGKPRFFNDITIYSFSQQQFSQYTLINPIITSWKHDTHDYSEANGTMAHSMQIQYETVKYYNGRISDATVPGFTDQAHYDNSPSSLKQGTTSILGSGGLVDNAQTIVGAIQDPSVANILGAIQAGANIEDILKSPGLKEEANQVLKDVIRNKGPSTVETIINKADSVFFPKPNTAPNAGVKNTPRPVTQSPKGPDTGSATVDEGTWT